MKKTIKILSLVVAFVCTTSTFAQKTGDIVETAASVKDFSTLVTAVKAAELVKVLQSDGPFTVFAPTNAAFNNLPKGTVETLLQPENKEKLQAVLTYHVVKGNLMASDVVEALQKNDGKMKVETVQGASLTVTLEDGKVKLYDNNKNVATVVKTDVKATNGVIHVIDTVVLP
jgi:uncharacterized surface protein with fasciclin (FAS1) repeats